VDADALVSDYRTVRLFTWAMPVLGVIGTVLGIGLAVGGFSELVATNVGSGSVDNVTAELGTAASGLSLALDTTILGLLAGLVVGVLSVGVRVREERSLARLDELSLEIIARAPSDAGSGASEVVAADSPLGPAASEAGPEGSELGSATAEVGPAVGSLGERVERLADRTEALRASVETALEGLRKADERLDEGFEGLDRRVARMEGAHERLATSIDEFGTRLGELTEAQAALRPVLTRLTGPLELRLTPSPAEDSASDASVDDSPEGAAAESLGSTTYQVTSDRGGIGDREKVEFPIPIRGADDPLRARPQGGVGSGPDEEAFD
jgi:hypothetical protein